MEKNYPEGRGKELIRTNLEASEGVFRWTDVKFHLTRWWWGLTRCGQHIDVGYYGMPAILISHLY